MRDNIVFNYSVILLPVILLLIGIFWIIRFTITPPLVFLIFLPTLAVFFFKIPYVLTKSFGIDSGLLRTGGNVCMFLSILLVPFAAYHLVEFFAWDLADAALLGMFASTLYVNSVIFAFSLDELKNVDVIGTFFTTWGVFSEVASIRGIAVYSAISLILGSLGWLFAKLF